MFNVSTAFFQYLHPEKEQDGKPIIKHSSNKNKYLFGVFDGVSQTDTHPILNLPRLASNYAADNIDLLNIERDNYYIPILYNIHNYLRKEGGGGATTASLVEINKILFKAKYYYSGDSRIDLLRNNRLFSLNKFEHGIKVKGSLTSALGHPLRYEIEISKGEIDIFPGDRIILATDLIERIGIKNSELEYLFEINRNPNDFVKNLEDLLWEKNKGFNYLPDDGTVIVAYIN